MEDLVTRYLNGWEGRWRERGLLSRHLAPGRSDDEIVSRLTEEFGTAPPPDLVAWFSWQDGSIDEWEAAPTGHALLGLVEALLSRRLNLSVNDEQDIAEGGKAFSPRWIPLTSGKGWFRVMDVDTGAIQAFDWWDAETPILVSPELYACVSNWTGILDLGLYAWDEARGLWVVNEEDVPDKLRRARLVG